MTEHFNHTQIKTCSQCKKDLHVAAFGKLKKQKDGLNPLCKQCARAYFSKYRIRCAAELTLYHKNYRTKNSARMKQATKDWKCTNHGSEVAAARYYTFNVTQEQFEDMVTEQDGLCAICGKPEWVIYRGKIRSLCIDHNHITGKIRRLLCNTCNRVLGLMGDDPERLRKAASYLEMYNG